MIGVFLVDDHEMVRLGLSQMLAPQADIRLVGEAATAAETLARVPALRPDVVVIDVRLPDGDGVAVCRELRDTITPPPACLMLTSYTDDEALFAAVRAGASGFLLKEVSKLDLVDAVRTVAAGGSLLDRKMIATVLHRLRGGPGADPRHATLTERERRILELIGDGLTNRQIGTRLHLAEKTVKNHVTVLLRKLGLQRRAEVAAYAARHRWI